MTGRGRLRVYLLRHVQVALNSLGRLYRAPVASLMTAAVIGIALALPAGLYLLTGNLQRLSTHWDGSAAVSLFLHKQVTDGQAGALVRRLQAWPEIDRVELITPEQALAEFRELSGFGEVLDTLDENPLPAVLAIKPAARAGSREQAGRLLSRLQQLPQVELAQLDLQWVQRFNAMVELARTGIILIAALLGLAVLLIVGNTIRLEIQNRRDEIEITQLIGATDAFIRRPFLYTGLWYGLLGAGLAWLWVELAFWQLYAPVQRLAGLYQSGFTLSAFSATQSLGLLAAGTLLGLFGAWLAVGRHLGAIEPA